MDPAGDGAAGGTVLILARVVVSHRGNLAPTSGCLIPDYPGGECPRGTGYTGNMRTTQSTEQTSPPHGGGVGGYFFVRSGPFGNPPRSPLREGGRQTWETLSPIGYNEGTLGIQGGRV